MTATQRRKAEKDAKADLERLLLGWSGALMFQDISGDTRQIARVAAAATRKALKAGTAPAEAMRQHLASAFEVGE